MHAPHAAESGYSPTLSIELELHGRSYEVASIGADFLIVRNAAQAAAGCGTVRVIIGGEATAFRVELPFGLHSNTDRQAIQPVTALQPVIATPALA